MAANITTIKNVDVDILIFSMREMKKSKNPAFLATFDLRYGDVVMRGWKIIKGPKDGNLFMCPATTRGAKPGFYFPSFCIYDKTTRMMIEQMAIACYQKMVKGELTEADFPDFMEGED